MASIASFICVISKQWSFYGSEGQFTDTGSQGRTVLTQKTSGSFGVVKKVGDKEFAGDDSAIGRSEIQQGTGARFKFKLIDKLTPPHERSC